ncbi:RibD family protein, partial [Hansschlegelia beijingensis]|uniref:RibD family protein n=1 Tax=Hansschlegelia beijingensis TaxID=1133344 RepID=UPI00387F13FB
MMLPVARPEALVLAQLGQSLDGRIATLGGGSALINGPCGLDHLHRLRALADAVLVGVGTVCADDCQLTVPTPTCTGFAPWRTPCWWASAPSAGN